MSILLIIQHAPYNKAKAKEALDMMLSAVSLDMVTRVCFIHDGVFVLNTAQISPADNAINSTKLYTKTFGALTDFGVSDIYTHSPSLQARGLETKNLFIPTQSINDQELRQLINSADKVITF